MAHSHHGSRSELVSPAPVHGSRSGPQLPADIFPDWRDSRFSRPPESLPGRSTQKLVQAEPRPLRFFDTPTSALDVNSTTYRSPVDYGHPEKDYAEETQLSRSYADRDLCTRNWCIVALVLGWCVSITAVTVGGYVIASGRQLLPSWLLYKYMVMGGNTYPWSHEYLDVLYYFTNHRVYNMPEAAMVLTSLLLNTALTVIFDSINYIHSTTLRWALWKEGRLSFNANPRFFIWTRQHTANSWYVNILSGLALVLTYSSASIVVFNVYLEGVVSDKGYKITSTQISGPRYGLDFNAWGLVGLGIGLFIQSLISTWSLLTSSIVETWTSNPLGTAKACVLAGTTSNSLESTFPGAKSTFGSVSSTSTLNRYNSFNNAVSTPRESQPSAGSTIPQARRIASFVWLIFGLLLVWTIIIALIAIFSKRTSSEYVLKTSHRLDVLSYWSSWGQVSIPYYIDPYYNRRDWLGVIIQCPCFAVVMIGLHSLDLLTQIHRDEAIWRKASSIGAPLTTGAIIEGFTDWPTWLLFAFKCVVPWVFGYAFSANCYVFMTLIPLIALSVLFLCMGLFAEFLICQKPKGPQPATYGNIFALAAFVDEWDHKKIFWGDKGEASAGIRCAGTAGYRLADLQMDALYSGLRWQLGTPEIQRL